MSSENQYYVYIVTNTVNNKKYIGKHYGKTDDSYLGSGRLIKQAIEKYGKESFIKYILYSSDSNKDIDSVEKFYIEKLEAIKSSRFYNLAEGGTGGNTLTSKEIIDKRNKKFQLYLSSLSKIEKEKISRLRSNSMKKIRKNNEVEYKRRQSLEQTISSKSKEDIKKDYKSRSGYNSYYAKKVSTPKGIFYCLKDAAKVFNVSNSTIANRCKNPKFIDWQFV